jgi:hypothetical protein
MATRYTIDGLSAMASKIGTLEADRRSDLSAFLAGTQASGGLARARRVAARLSGNPPDNLTDNKAASMWRDLVNRANAITNG